ncbi:hypothetical protein EDB83DRAFT_2683103 [Lactarius deliciosus]|nr:hypothetical protein EDB83DRAFT_2683103 [Lactarius deliciosus]
MDHLAGALKKGGIKDGTDSVLDAHFRSQVVDWWTRKQNAVKAIKESLEHEDQHKRRFLPSDFGLLSSVELIPCVPQHAALARSLSDSNPTFSRLRQPPIRSFVLRRRVRDRLRSLATTRPLRLSVASPDLAALARGLSPSIQTLRAQQMPVRHLVLLHTSQFLHTLDAFPSDQGRLRLLVWIIGTRKGVIRDF